MTRELERQGGRKLWEVRKVKRFGMLGRSKSLEVVEAGIFRRLVKSEILGGWKFWDVR
jgi:hypothetical protein